MPTSLDWSLPDDFGQCEAKYGPFTFIAWQGKEYGELRMIRRDNVGGVIAPISDFSIYARDIDQAKYLAENLSIALLPVVKYNTFTPLYE
jgi:predicted transcriptional regulator